MTEVTTLSDWSDDRGNRIEHPGSVDEDVRVEFTGRNNKLVVHAPIEPPTIADPTINDAKAFADRVHGIVSATVTSRQSSVASPKSPVSSQAADR